MCASTSKHLWLSPVTPIRVRVTSHTCTQISSSPSLLPQHTAAWVSRISTPALLSGSPIFFSCSHTFPCLIPCLRLRPPSPDKSASVTSLKQISYFVMWDTGGGKVALMAAKKNNNKTNTHTPLRLLHTQTRRTGKWHVLLPSALSPVSWADRPRLLSCP